MRGTVAQWLTRPWLCGALAALVVLGAAAVPPAHAVFELFLLDLDTGAFVVVDDNVGGDANVVVGAITFVGPLGEWLVNVTTATSKPLTGSATNPIMDLNSLNISFSSDGDGASILIASSDDGFLGPGTSNLLSTLGGTTVGAVTAQQCIGPSLFACFSDAIIFHGPFVGAPGAPLAFSDQQGLPVTLPATFSLSEFAVISHADGDGLNTSFNLDSRIAPEPASLLLLGTGLVGLALIARRRAS